MQSKAKLLMVCHRVPHPPRKGDRIRVWHMIKHLSQEFDIDLATLADEPLTLRSWQAMEQFTNQIAIEPLHRGERLNAAMRSFAKGHSLSEGLFYNDKLKRTIDRWASETVYDAGLAICSSTARYFDGMDLPYKAIDLIDVDSQKFEDYAQQARGLKRWMYASEARRLRDCERRITEQFDGLMVTTPAEAELWRSIAPQADVTPIANGVDVDYFMPRRHVHQQVAVFTGALDYRPNIDAAVHFAREIWPVVHDNLPEARFNIVGRRPVHAVRQLGAIDGVHVLGEVPDVRPHIAEAAVAVVPLQIARGVQNKVLEAMAMAKPVVASAQALAGLEVQPEREVFQASTDAQWVQQMIHLLSHPARGQGVAAAARDYVLDHHRWDRCLIPMLELLKGGVASQTGRGDRHARRAA